MHWAVERGCCGTVEALLKHGANPNIESKFDKTPLEIASENGRPDIFEILQVILKETVQFLAAKVISQQVSQNWLKSRVISPLF